MLKMLLPITLPTAMSAFCARVACRLTAICGCAAAEGDDGQADDQRAHMQPRGQAYGGAHHQFGAGDQQEQPAEQFDHADQG